MSEKVLANSTVKIKIRENMVLHITRHKYIHSMEIKYGKK